MRRCSLNHMPVGGVWDLGERRFTPRGQNCTMDADMSPAAASQCLRNRTLVFMGDSNIRDLGIAMACTRGKQANMSPHVWPWMLSLLTPAHAPLRCSLLCAALLFRMRT